MYLLALLKSQGLSRDALHITFTAIVLSVITYALPSFARQLSVGDKAALTVYFGKILGVDLLHDEKQMAENRALGNTARGGIERRESIITPHRSTTYVDTSYCYWPSSVVCRSVTVVNPAKMAQPIEMPFGLRMGVGP